MLAPAAFVPAGATEAPNRAELLNLAGKSTDPFAGTEAKLLAFIFVGADCPISNSYAPEVQRLHAAFAQRGVTFFLVYPDGGISAAAIREHLKSYDYPCDALRDQQHAFTKRAHVEVTPEAALFRPDGTLLYHGRIDNRYAALGSKRPKATERDFVNALDDALAGNPVRPAGGPPVGCFIEGAR
jgi:hypothetical protein